VSVIFETLVVFTTLCLQVFFSVELLSDLISLALYWFVSSLQHEYFEKHPGGVNPVRANDVFFTVHAILLTFITVLQCVFYDVSKLYLVRIQIVI